MVLSSICNQDFADFQEKFTSAYRTAANFVYEIPEWVVVAVVLGGIALFVFGIGSCISASCFGLAGSTVATRFAAKVIQHYHPQQVKAFRRKLYDFHNKHSYTVYLATFISFVAALLLYPIGAVGVSVAFGVYMGVIVEKEIYKYKKHLQRERLANPVLDPESQIDDS